MECLEFRVSSSARFGFATVGRARAQGPKCHRNNTLTEEERTVERERETSWSNLDVPSVARYGVTGGIIAGVFFALAEVIAAALSGSPAYAPLQMIAAIAMGDRVLTEADLTVQTLFVALGVHFALSIVYGLILAVLAMAALAVGSSTLTLAIGGMVWGLVLWLVNFYLIAPLAFPWFTVTDQVVQFVAHVLVFGGILGLYLGRRLGVSHES